MRHDASGLVHGLSHAPQRELSKAHLSSMTDRLIDNLDTSPWISLTRHRQSSR